MIVELTIPEAEMLLNLLQAADLERPNELRRAGGAEGRRQIGSDAELIRGTQQKLESALLGAEGEAMLDESVEESFPASDPPARSSYHRGHEPPQRPN